MLCRKSRTTLYFLRQLFVTCSNLICCQFVDECLRTSYTFFLFAVLPYLDLPLELSLTLYNKGSLSHSYHFIFCLSILLVISWSANELGVGMSAIDLPQFFSLSQRIYLTTQPRILSYTVFKTYRKLLVCSSQKKARITEDPCIREKINKYYNIIFHIKFV